VSNPPDTHPLSATPPRQVCSLGLESRPARKQSRGRARLGLEVSAGWASPSSHGLWGGDAPLLQFPTRRRYLRPNNASHALDLACRLTFDGIAIACAKAAGKEAMIVHYDAEVRPPPHLPGLRRRQYTAL
jgi:hypothetical protein